MKKKVMTFAEEGDDMLMGFKGGGLRLKESKILPALAGWRGDKSQEKFTDGKTFSNLVHLEDGNCGKICFLGDKT